MNMKRLLAVAALSVAIAASVDAGDSPAVRRGREEARNDIRRGELVLRTYGYGAHATDSPYFRALRERFGVRIQPVGGCLVKPETIAATAGYNEVMRAEIRKRFGAKALEEVESLYK